MINCRGFTVVEVIVALTLFSVGIIALTAASSMVTRMLGEGQQYSEASAVANRRFELLRSQDCATLGAGSATEGHFTVTWSADSVGSRTPGRRVAVTISFPTATGTRSANFSSLISCPV